MINTINNGVLDCAGLGDESPRHAAWVRPVSRHRESASHGTVSIGIRLLVGANVVGDDDHHRRLSMGDERRAAPKLPRAGVR